ncbi:MAG: hypothetical protein F6J87_13050 [Spirulina sp. SIO3F2]|nr:hypothetical protein [Spirulina sp. SIO3F2]
MTTPQIPFLSLGIVWLVHGVLGWLLAETTYYWLHWSLAACLIVLMALVFTAPSSMVRNVFYGLFRSDSRAFFSVILCALTVVLMVHWSTQSVYIIVLLAAGSLARLELQGAEYGEWQSFTLLTLISLAGFATGLGAYVYLLTHNTV